MVVGCLMVVGWFADDFVLVCLVASLVAAELALLLAGGLRELLLVVSVLVGLSFRGYCGCHGWLGDSGVGCLPWFLLWVLI